MPIRCQLPLTAEQQAALVRLRDHVDVPPVTIVLDPDALQNLHGRNFAQICRNCRIKELREQRPLIPSEGLRERSTAGRVSPKRLLFDGCP